MTHFLQMRESNVFRKYGHILLALFWTLGFSFGISFFFGSHSFLMMPVITKLHLSIVELIFTSFIPFVFFAFAAFISQPLLLLLFSFLRATVFSFVFCLVSFWFGESGWIFGVLYCFHSIVLMPIIFWYTLHSIRNQAVFRWKAFFFVSAVCVFTSMMEYRYILPLLGDMLDYWKG